MDTTDMDSGHTDSALTTADTSTATDMVVTDIPTTDKDKLISPDICKKGQICNAEIVQCSD